jgi:hypothetical protein
VTDGASLLDQFIERVRPLGVRAEGVADAEAAALVVHEEASAVDLVWITVSSEVRRWAPDLLDTIGALLTVTIAADPASVRFSTCRWR